MDSIHFPFRPFLCSFVCFNGLDAHKSCIMTWRRVTTNKPKTQSLSQTDKTKCISYKVYLYRNQCSTGSHWQSLLSQWAGYAIGRHPSQTEYERDTLSHPVLQSHSLQLAVLK